MTSRVRRIILIDGKTSGVTSSGCINELDPRGGAAITGENGVGKTTSLQIIPLFFGCLPSSIVQKHSTVEAMLKFMLPHATSAIVFEYQRGDDADDVRLVTIRRSKTSDAPEYRFFKTAYREDLFTGPHGTSELMLLDDEGVHRKASALKIIVEGKLEASKYRAVILKTRSQTRDAKDIIKLQQDYSFARRPLPHLDRLVGAIIKEKIDFRDFVAVAVAMVEEAVGSEAKKERPSLKGMRGQIDLWLANRDACAKADRMKPEMQALLANVDKYRKHRSSMGGLRADVRSLMGLSRQAHTRADEGLKALQESRRLTVEDEQLTLLRLTDALHRLQGEASTLSTELQALQDREKFFLREDVAFWTEKVKELPQLKAQMEQNDRAIRLAKSAAADIAAQMDSAIAQLLQETASQLEKIEILKAEPNAAYGRAVDALGAREQEERAALESRQLTAFQEIDAALDTLRDEFSEAKARIDAPVVPAEALAKLSDAQSLLEKITGAVDDARTQQGLASTAVAEAKSHFSEAAHAQRTAEAGVAKAQESLDSVKRAQKPKEGTLLASLHDSADQSWRGDLARFIDPALLAQPIQVVMPQDDDRTDTVFGWHFPQLDLAIPAWADADALARHITEKAEILGQGQAILSQANDTLAAASEGLKTAQAALSLAEAALDIAQRNKARQSGVVSECQAQITEVRKHLVEKSRSAAAAIEAQLTQMRRRKTELQQLQTQETKTFNTTLTTDRLDLAQVRDGAISAIDGQKASFKAAQEQAQKKLEAERERKLKEGGVDFDHLQALERRHDALKLQIAEQSNKVSVVESWTTWLDEGMPNKLVTLAQQVQDLKRSIEQGVSGVGQKKSAMAQSKAAHETAEAALQSALNLSKNDAENLALLDDKLQEFHPASTSAVSSDTPVSQLQGQVDNALKQLERQGGEIANSTRANEQKLVSSNSAVSELISKRIAEATAKEGEFDRIQRAEVLCQAFNEIDRQVVSMVNTELGTIMFLLVEFRERIRAYESGVQAFNKKLQAGISGVVSTFDRLKDFKINVITNFEKIGFIKRLDELDEVAEKQRAAVFMDHNHEIPDEATAIKLRAVVNDLGPSGLEVDVGQHITLSGSANDAGVMKHFHDEQGLQHLSSTGITAIAMITLLAGMLNVVRGTDPIYIPWASDEVGRFDAGNFARLMEMLSENKIDVVTASPLLTAATYGYFSQRYLFLAGSEWSTYLGDSSRLEGINADRIEKERLALDQHAQEQEQVQGVL